MLHTHAQTIRRLRDASTFPLAPPPHASERDELSRENARTVSALLLGPRTSRAAGQRLSLPERASALFYLARAVQRARRYYSIGIEIDCSGGGCF